MSCPGRRVRDWFAWEPPPVLPVQPVTLRRGQSLEVGQPFTVLCWNLQFCASRRHEFFYDGGRAVHVPKADVRRTLAAITSVLADERPDVALLQEVDRDSARTGRVDQLQPLLEAGDWCAWASTPYHQARYVPVPSHRPLGRIGMHLAVLSRFPLGPGRRIDLPRLDEPRWRQALNLKRALLSMPLAVAGETALRLGSVHLSAFSRGDGTLALQTARLAAWMRRRPDFLLGGDFNLLPPGDDPARLGVEVGHYPEGSPPLRRLLDAFDDVSGHRVADPAWRTYLPFGATSPDRRLDYLFHGTRLEVLEACVLRQYSELSDHLPVRARLRVKGGLGR